MQTKPTNADKPETHPRNLTDAFVRGLKNSTSQRLEIRDTYVTGLVLRVTPSGTKTFSLQTRSAADEKMQITIGRYPAVSIKDARDIAMGHLANIARGTDPRELTRLARAKTAADGVTLGALLDEVEVVFGLTKSMWRKNNRFGYAKAEARAAIENVFEPLLKASLLGLTAVDFATTMKRYKPKKPKAGKTTANGAVSRALAYLRPVFDWASGRGRFKKEGAARELKLDLPDLSTVHDPSVDDPTLEFRRDRVLSQDELVAVMPLLVYPAPEGLREKIDPKEDYGPVAFRFLLLTLSRREEVSSAKRKDFDLRARTWTKLVKTKRKPGSRAPVEKRLVTIPLSDEAIALLLSLPSFVDGGPDDFVFPSSAGGRLCNWERTQATIYKASKTSDWHRHDLRRTGATILNQLGVLPGVIDTLLCHVNPLSAEKVSGSAANYIFDTKILHAAVDQERVAVNLLAKGLASICGRATISQVTTMRGSLKEESTVPKKPSPWSAAA